MNNDDTKRDDDGWYIVEMCLPNHRYECKDYLMEILQSVPVGYVFRFRIMDFLIFEKIVEKD